MRHPLNSHDRATLMCSERRGRKGPFLSPYGISQRVALLRRNTSCFSNVFPSGFFTLAREQGEPEGYRPYRSTK